MMRLGETSAHKIDFRERCLPFSSYRCTSRRRVGGGPLERHENVRMSGRDARKKRRVAPIFAVARFAR